MIGRSLVTLCMLQVFVSIFRVGVAFPEEVVVMDKSEMIKQFEQANNPHSPVQYSNAAHSDITNLNILKIGSALGATKRHPETQFQPYYSRERTFYDTLKDMHIIFKTILIVMIQPLFVVYLGIYSNS